MKVTRLPELSFARIRCGHRRPGGRARGCEGSILWLTESSSYNVEAQLGSPARI
jgi:hypothetical protein